MRIKRSVFKIEKDKQKRLMKKLISDGMSFDEFIDRAIYMFLDGKYEITK